MSYEYCIMIYFTNSWTKLFGSTPEVVEARYRYVTQGRKPLYRVVARLK